jgi:hypothetical protein
MDRCQFTHGQPSEEFLVVLGVARASFVNVVQGQFESSLIVCTA